MKLILHIGPNKTGTTTLQHCFRDNRKKLRRMGVFYPAMPLRFSQHFALVPALSNGELGQNNFGCRKIWGDVDFLAPSLKLWNKFLRLARWNRAKYLLISSEFISSFGPKQIAYMSNFLSQYFEDITIVAYARNPAEHFFSAYQQSVKINGHIANFGALSNRRFQIWSEPDNFKLSVRPYARERLLNGDIIDDFMATYLPHVDQSRLIAPKSSRNVSLSTEAISVLEDLIPGIKPDVDQFKRRVIWMEIAREMIKFDSQVPNGTRPRMRADLNKHLSEQISELLWLKAEYGIEFEHVDYSKIEENSLADKKVYKIQDMCEVDLTRKAELENRLHSLSKSKLSDAFNFLGLDQES